MNKGLFLRYGSIILFVFCVVRLAWLAMPSVTGLWELHAGDQLMRLSYHWQGKREISPDIVHVDLDDQSIATLPYSKSDPRLYAEMIRILSAAGVRTVLVDMLFPQCREDGCEQMAAEIQKAGNVYFPVILSSQKRSEHTKIADNKTVDKAIWKIASKDNVNSVGSEIILTNYEALNENVAGLGHINSPPDPDGVYRRIPLFINHAEGLVPSIALRAACQYLNVSPENIHLQPGRYVALNKATDPIGQTQNIYIPINKKMQNRINFSGPWNDSFAHYSLSDIITLGATNEGLMELTDELEDALVIVSDVSTGGRDFGPMPLESNSPLSGLYSHLINSILVNDFLVEAGFGYNLLIDIGLIILLTFAAVFFRGVRFALVANLLILGIIGVCFYLFLEQRILVASVRPCLSLGLSVSLVILMQYLDVQKKKQYIQATLTNYFAPPLMDKILNNPELIQGVDKKKLTILFSDIVAFSSWASTRDAQEIHNTLNRYFEEMAAIVFAHGGTIDKYIGDGLMVFFGDPTPYPDHALRAIQTAQQMQKRTRELRQEWEKNGGLPIDVRIGIHSGEAVVGNMGSQARMDYTVIGSNVNLAQRLESSCPPGDILVSDQVVKETEGQFVFTPVGQIMVKGFSEPVSAYTVN